MNHISGKIEYFLALQETLCKEKDEFYEILCNINKLCIKTEQQLIMNLDSLINTYKLCLREVHLLLDVS